MSTTLQRPNSGSGGGSGVENPRGPSTPRYESFDNEKRYIVLVGDEIGDVLPSIYEEVQRIIWDNPELELRVMPYEELSERADYVRGRIDDRGIAGVLYCDITSVSVERIRDIAIRVIEPQVLLNDEERMRACPEKLMTDVRNQMRIDVSLFVVESKTQFPPVEIPEDERDDMSVGDYVARTIIGFDYNTLYLDNDNDRAMKLVDRFFPPGDI